MSIHAKKHQPHTFWKLVAVFKREVRGDEGYVACPMHNQAISHPCSFCIKEQQPCLWASRGLTLLLCPVSLSHQMYLPHKNCHIKNYTCIRGVMLEARAIFTHELLENQSTVLFLCSPTSCYCPALYRWTATKLLQQPEGTWT